MLSDVMLSHVFEMWQWIKSNRKLDMDWSASELKPAFIGSDTDFAEWLAASLLHPSVFSCSVLVCCSPFPPFPVWSFAFLSSSVVIFAALHCSLSCSVLMQNHSMQTDRALAAERMRNTWTAFTQLKNNCLEPKAPNGKTTEHHAVNRWITVEESLCTVFVCAENVQYMFLHDHFPICGLVLHSNILLL